MIFKETEIPGVFLVESEPHTDKRGTFTRIWDMAELAAHGLEAAPKQWSLSSNTRAGTLRGLHYQAEPHAEAKLVRCIRGALYDVVLDLRRDSPTFKGWLAVELRAGDARALYIPEGLAHGFQTLEDDTEVLYAISAHYEASASRGVRWDDPAFGIEWPAADSRIISEKDRSWPDFTS
jgi:dTDP-4-dehydrorhamnose 3,5-epimerase